MYQKFFKVSVCLAAIFLTSGSEVASKVDGSSGELCHGFAPQNKVSYPVNSKARSSVTEAQFNQVLDHIQNIYAPIVQARGGQLEIRRLWSDGTANASAERIGRTTYRINMYGGLARHPLMTADGFMLVACHEMGHHVAGKPKVSSFWGGTSWARSKVSPTTTAPENACARFTNQ